MTTVPPLPHVQPTMTVPANESGSFTGISSLNSVSFSTQDTHASSWS